MRLQPLHELLAEGIVPDGHETRIKLWSKQFQMGDGIDCLGRMVIQKGDLISAGLGGLGNDMAVATSTDDKERFHLHEKKKFTFGRMEQPFVTAPAQTP